MASASSCSGTATGCGCSPGTATIGPTGIRGSSIRQKQFVIDGEAVIVGVDGLSDFAALYSRRNDHEVQFYAFDMLAGEGEDLRSLPLSLRKTNLSRLLARRTDGIFVAQFELGEIGPDLFRAACNMELEGLVSKHRDQPYRAGRSPYWVKVKNPVSPAMTRAMAVEWSTPVKSRC